MALQKLSERRNSLRYRVSLELDLVLANGGILPVTANNLSHHGLQFTCDSWVANEIEPRGIHNHPLGHIQLKVVAPLANGEKLYARCRIITARRLSQETYLIGLKFVSFENGSDTLLNEFLNSLK